MNDSSPSLVIQNLPVDSLQPNPWNTNRVSPENEAKIEASLKRFGFIRPILARSTEDGFEILGGQHRWEVAIRMGYESVPVIDLGFVPDQKAKEIGLVDNGRYGEDDTLELANLLRSLGSVDDLATFLPYTGADFDQIFAASEIDLETLGLPDAGADPLPDLGAQAAPTAQIMRFKVPLGDAPTIEKMIETTMKAQGFTAGDSLANAGDALVYLLCGGSTK